MSRAARVTAGAVVAGVLAFVALVAAVMSGLSSAASWSDDGAWLAAGVDEPTRAEVLDVDDDAGWATVDVRLTTAEGEVVVTWVDWEHHDDLPAVGAEIDIVYDPLDPEYAFAADDPYVTGAAQGSGSTTVPDVSAAGAVPEVAGWVALGGLGGLVITVLLTVLAALRAPAPSRPDDLPGSAPWPYPERTPPAAPGRHDPYARPVGPRAGPPSQPGWSHPG